MEARKSIKAARLARKELNLSLKRGLIVLLSFVLFVAWLTAIVVVTKFVIG